MIEPDNIKPPIAVMLFILAMMIGGDIFYYHLLKRRSETIRMTLVCLDQHLTESPEWQQLGKEHRTESWLVPIVSGVLGIFNWGLIFALARDGYNFRKILLTAGAVVSLITKLGLTIKLGR